MRMSTLRMAYVVGFSCSDAISFSVGRMQESTPPT